MLSEEFIPIIHFPQSEESYIDSRPILQSWHCELLSDMAALEKNGSCHL
jgi:hypothetical protein